MIQISSVNELAYPNVVVKDASIQNYISVALLAVAIYEHVLTLPQETSYLWRRKFTLVSALVFLLKYGVLAYQGFSVVSIFVPAEATCGVLLRFTQACFLLLMVLFCVGSTLRVYALSQSTGIAITVAVLGTGQVVDNTYTFAYSNASTLSVPSATCLSVFEYSAGVTSRLTIASRISTALADAIVITVTLKRTIGIVRDAARINIKIPVVASLLQDGTLYFLVALAMNITQVVVFETLQELYLSPFILVVTSILLSRLFLDLREAQMASGARRHTSEPTTSIFVSVIVVRTVEDAESCINIGPEQTNKGEQGLSMHESASLPFVDSSRAILGLTAIS